MPINGCSCKFYDTAGTICTVLATVNEHLKLYKSLQYIPCMFFSIIHLLHYFGGDTKERSDEHKRFHHCSSFVQIHKSYDSQNFLINTGTRTTCKRPTGQAVSTAIWAVPAAGTTSDRTRSNEGKAGHH